MHNLISCDKIRMMMGEVPLKPINSKQIKDCVVIGAALFAMFFGAGNMIFPPYLGLRAGVEWFAAFMGYYLADVGLAVVAMLALIRSGGSEGLLRPLGRVWSTGLMVSIMMCLGPLISIPRTAATTFELSVAPLWRGAQAELFCGGFFVVVFLLSVNESAVVDIVGKILTPVLFVSLLILIVKGVLFPLGAVTAPPISDRVVASGISAGYQTMDVLASVVFGALILNSAARKGYTAPKEQAAASVGASLVAGAGLLLIYAGLTYLGATAQALPNTRLTRIELLVALVQAILPGKMGMVFFGVIAALACLTTAIALTSAAGKYFAELTRGRVSYRVWVAAICAFSAGVSGIGVERLVELASPILGVVYPPVLALVVLSFAGKQNARWFYRLPAGAAMMVGLLEIMGEPVVERLPLAGLGLAWVMPVCLSAAMGYILDTRYEKTLPSA